MSDVFISYATADRKYAGLLAKALGRQGWTVWWDRTILPGSNWRAVIQSALDSASCVVVLWSRNSVESEWVQTEAEEARVRGILVPACLDVVRIPLQFRLIHAASLVGWDGRPSHDGFRTLVQGISAIQARGAAPKAAASVSSVVEPAATNDRPDVPARTVPVTREGRFRTPKWPGLPPWTRSRGWWRVLAGVAVIVAFACLVKVGIIPLSKRASWSGTPPTEDVSYQAYKSKANILYSLGVKQDLTFKQGDTDNGKGLITTSSVYKLDRNIVHPYPYVTVANANSNKKDCSDCLLLLHPDVVAAAVVTVKLRSKGAYMVDATFARANDVIGAGNGVRVLVCVNGRFDDPLWVKNIPSDRQVETSNVFFGDGTERFKDTLHLNAGDFLQFAVFVGENPNDPNDKNPDYDVTALKAVISGNGSSIVLPLDGKGGWR